MSSNHAHETLSRKGSLGRARPCGTLDMKSSIMYDEGMARRANSLSDQIRQAVDASDMSRYAICKSLGIDQAAMSRFMAGAGMELATVDRLADLLGLTIKRPKRRAGKRR